MPASEVVRALVDAAYEQFRDDRRGEVSRVYPALARAEPDRFGIALVGTSGREYRAGDADHPFAIMSVSKPFAFALVCDAAGAAAARERLGVNATGLPFNSLAAVEYSPDGRTNPMVNAGAIATSAMTPGTSVEERWSRLQEGLSRFAGRRLELEPEIYASASVTNHRNDAIARLLIDRGRLMGDPADAVELYTRQCSREVTARDLAVMGATLADGGVNPVTGERVVSREVCHYALAVMLTAGLYETPWFVCSRWRSLRGSALVRPEASSVAIVSLRLAGRI